MKGICQKLLEIDLTSGKTKDRLIAEEMFKKYLGGRGLGVRLLWDLLPAQTDPFSPENIILFLTGPLTGSMVNGRNIRSLDGLETKIQDGDELTFTVLVAGG